MTATADASLPSITCPSSLIASCPPLLGFYPERSLICLAHRSGISTPVVARIDVVEDDRAESCADDLAQRLARTGCSHVTVVLWLGVPDGADRRELPGILLVEHLERSLAGLGLSIDFAVATNATVWWPLLCPTASCCSHGARPLDTEVAGRVRVQYAVAGYAPLASRDDLSEQLAADPELVARSRRFLMDNRASSTTLAQRRREVDQMWQALRPLSPNPESRQRACDPGRHLDVEQRTQPLWPAPQGGSRGVGAASPESAVRALGDVGIRDAILVRLAKDQSACRTCWRHSIAVLSEVVRAAPPGHVAPGATLLGLVAWLSGDGALGTVALERALDDDPDYRLALLARDLLSSGLDPRRWRETATDLTEEACLRQARCRRSGPPTASHPQGAGSSTGL